MGQEINQKEQSLEKLQEQSKALEIQVAQLRSSYQFENERERLNLVNPDQVSFIEIGKSNEMAMITE
jgi:cell division protein FtsB